MHFTCSYTNSKKNSGAAGEISYDSQIIAFAHVFQLYVVVNRHTLHRQDWIITFFFHAVNLKPNLFIYFNVWLNVHLELYCIMNQHDAIIVLTFWVTTPLHVTGPICSPSSAGRIYIYAVNGTCFTSKSSVGGPGWKWVNFYPHIQIYTFYLLMMGYKWARNT
jgi:hypothetical protein